MSMIDMMAECIAALEAEVASRREQVESLQQTLDECVVASGSEGCLWVNLPTVISDLRRRDFEKRIAEQDAELAEAKARADEPCAYCEAAGKMLEDQDKHLAAAERLAALADHSNECRGPDGCMCGYDDAVRAYQASRGK